MFILICCIIIVMARQKRSSVWEFFVKEGDKSVKCTLCNTILIYHGRTSSMQSHLSGKHNRMVTVNDDSSHSTTSSDSCSSQSSIDSFIGVKRKCSSDRATKVTKLVCEMVARDLRLVSIVKVMVSNGLLTTLSLSIGCHRTRILPVFVIACFKWRGETRS